MNEIENAIVLDATVAGKYNLATIYETTALKIREVVERVLIQKDFFTDLPRAEFLEGNKVFKEEMRKHLGSSVKHIERVRRTDGKKTVAFLGNFEAHESTENMVKWALTERLNIHVETLQENKVNLAAIREAMEWNDCSCGFARPTGCRLTT